MNTQEFLMDKYGLMLTAKEASKVLRISYSLFMNKRSTGTLGLNSYVSNGRVYVASQDMANHLEGLRGLVPITSS
jgi:hypothetical protein